MLHQRLVAAVERCKVPIPTSLDKLSTLELCGMYVDWWQRNSARPVLHVRARDARQTPHTSAFIFCHGLGDTGEGWAYSFEAIAEQLPSVQFLFPTARTTPVTCNNGMTMPSWYDIAGLDVNRLKMDAPGIEESAVFLQAMIEIESYRIASHLSKKGDGNHEPAATGDYQATAAGRVMLGGFSQGGALTMYAAHTCDQKLGGMCVLSGYCTQLKDLAARNTTVNGTSPLLMCHGTDDGVVPFPLAQESFAWATKAALVAGQEGCLPIRAVGSESTFVPLDGVGHESSEEEMTKVAAFISKALKL